MIVSQGMTRQEIEMLMGAHRAFAAHQLDACAQVVKANQPLDAVHGLFNEAGDHLQRVEHWGGVLADFDRPAADATDAALGESDE